MNLDVLRERARIVSSIRRFFDEQDFIEVETAVRIPAPAPEEHIDCPPVEGGGYLRASPELQMKKLLAEGLDKIYQIGPCFREGERGTRHNPEFTMIEWYRRNATYLDILEDTERLMASLFRSSLVPLGSSFSRLRVRDAYVEFAGWDPWQGDWEQDRFDFDMATKIEPAIKALGGGVFLMDYPPQAASLSKLSPCSASPSISSSSTLSYAERWELYYNGMELANCFTELCDSEEQLRRFMVAKSARQQLGEADYPIDRAFIEALPRVANAAGVAMGVDRLVMILTQTKDISAVRAEI